jgi:uncharacterized repeat protein (TIGR01451 family)
VLSGGVVSWSKGTVTAGASTLDSVRVIANTTGLLSNVARTSSATADPDTADWRDTAETTVSASADLSIVKTATPAVTVGEMIEYVITVTNDGPDEAADVVVTDTLPAGVTFVSATNGGVIADGVVTWTKGSLASGAETVDTVVVTADAAGAPENIARVSSTTADPDGEDPRATASTTVSDPPEQPDR